MVLLQYYYKALSLLREILKKEKKKEHLAITVASRALFGKHNETCRLLTMKKGLRSRGANKKKKKTVNKTVKVLSLAKKTDPYLCKNRFQVKAFLNCLPCSRTFA